MLGKHWDGLKEAGKILLGDGSCVYYVDEERRVTFIDLLIYQRFSNRVLQMFIFMAHPNAATSNLYKILKRIGIKTRHQLVLAVYTLGT